MTHNKIFKEFVEVEKTIDEEINEIIDSLVADVHFEKTWPAHTTYYQIDLNQFQEKLKEAIATSYNNGVEDGRVERDKETPTAMAIVSL